MCHRAITDVLQGKRWIHLEEQTYKRNFLLPQREMSMIRNISKEIRKDPYLVWRRPDPFAKHNLSKVFHGSVIIAIGQTEVEAERKRKKILGPIDEM